jgi:hypothetical protein
MMRPLQTFGLVLTLFVFMACEEDQNEPIQDPTQFTATDFASGLKMPVGMSMDEKGQLWVAETGTGNNDAQVSMVTTAGTVHPVITGLNSVFANGAVEGMSHVLYDNGKLYILNGNAGRLYITDVASFKPGDAPKAASILESEDLRTFVHSLNLTDPLNSNAYQLTFGPDGHLFIVDAGANAIIKRDKNSKALSLFAHIPNLNPATEAVPTGIVFDGTKFLVSSLSGGPFIKGSAKIFQVGLNGNISDYKSGFTTATDILLTPNNKPLITEFAEFSLNPPGFVPATGRIANEDGVTLLGGLTMPTDLAREGDKTYYLLSYAEGTIRKLTY